MIFDKMEPTPNRSVQAPEARITEKRPMPSQERPRRSDELVAVDTQFFGFDRNFLITFACVGLSICISLYLFKEMKKMRDDIRIIKSQEPDTELTDKVEENSEAVKAIEVKLDQLITALSSRERRFQQQQQQQQQQPQAMQQSQPQVMQQPQQMMQPPQVTENEYQNQQIMAQQIAQQQMAQQMAQQQMAQQQMAQQQMEQQQQQQPPVMGGRLAGSAVVIEDPGTLRI